MLVCKGDSALMSQLQELRGQADVAGKKQQLADDEITALRQQLVSSQREARDAVTRMVSAGYYVRLCRISCGNGW